MPDKNKSKTVLSFDGSINEDGVISVSWESDENIEKLMAFPDVWEFVLSAAELLDFENELFEDLGVTDNDPETENTKFPDGNSEASDEPSGCGLAAAKQPCQTASASEPADSCARVIEAVRNLRKNAEERDALLEAIHTEIEARKDAGLPPSEKEIGVFGMLNRLLDAARGE